MLVEFDLKKSQYFLQPSLYVGFHHMKKLNSNWPISQENDKRKYKN